MRALLTLCAAALAGIAAPAQAQDPSDEALAKIALPKEQLNAMLADAVFTDRAMAINAFLLGIEPTCKIYAAAAEKAVVKYLPAWRKNLLAAFRTVVPADTLTSAAAEGPTGRNRLGGYMNQIGAVMEQSSQTILDQSSAEVRREIGAAAAGVNPGKIDQQARMRELQEQIAKTGKLCGVINAADNLAKSESLN
jgi:hypothetical protein